MRIGDFQDLAVLLIIGNQIVTKSFEKYCLHTNSVSTAAVGVVILELPGHTIMQKSVDFELISSI
jgi:hypothetical protein